MIQSIASGEHQLFQHTLPMIGIVSAFQYRHQLIGAKATTLDAPFETILRLLRVIWIAPRIPPNGLGANVPL